MTQLPFGGIGRGVNNAARGAVGGVDRLISAVEGLAGGIASIEHEMKGMRRDMREVIDSVEGLRRDLSGFDDIRTATTSMDREVQAMHQSLDGVNHLLDRYPRLLGRSAAEKRARRNETKPS
ncbi:MAG TPA: hypothetical protein VFY44_11910 [Thermoleophilaceae bacterium]|nr:hypothetical protein [Thermoleophilaceae bacterium]